MRDTLLANVGCLAVFQVAGSDARQMVWELGKDRVSEEDIVSLPVHQCYVRATVGTERMPAFSMMVSKPEDGDPATADRIRAKAASYVTTEEEMAAQQAEARRRVEEFRTAVKEAREGEEPAKNETEGRTQGPGAGRSAQQALPAANGEAEAGRRGRGGLTNEARGSRRPAAALPHALPRPAGGGGRLRLVQGRGLQRAVENLEAEGLAASVGHASELITGYPPTTGITAEAVCAAFGPRGGRSERGWAAPEPAGLGAVAARSDGAAGRRWRRLPPVHQPYRPSPIPYASAGISPMPMDAAVALPDGRVIAVVRQGAATDRTGFSKRLWRLREGTQPAAALLLMPDEARLRHARRMLAGAPFYRLSGPGEGRRLRGRRCAPSGARPPGRRSSTFAPSSTTRGREAPWPEEEPPARASLPADLDVEGGA